MRLPGHRRCHGGGAGGEGGIHCARPVAALVPHTPTPVLARTTITQAHRRCTIRSAPRPAPHTHRGTSLRGSLSCPACPQNGDKMLQIGMADAAVDAAKAEWLRLREVVHQALGALRANPTAEASAAVERAHHEWLAAFKLMMQLERELESRRTAGGLDGEGRGGLAAPGAGSTRTTAFPAHAAARARTACVLAPF